MVLNSKSLWYNILDYVMHSPILLGFSNKFKGYFMNYYHLLVSDFNVISVIIRLLIATILGGLIGFERGKHGHPAGIRTHTLVSIGAATAMMVGLYVFKVGLATDVSRIGAQVVSGIGFLGVGTILVKGREQITGLTTAATLWAAGTIGLASGAGFIEAAIGATIIITALNTILYKRSQKINVRSTIIIHMELDNIRNVNRTYDSLKADFPNIIIHAVPSKSGIENHIGIEAIFNYRSTNLGKTELVEKMRSYEGVVYAIEAY
ncbi:MAG: MgtC/SapB family protein [Lachnospiraceae bacterium]|nr:MgtC/SapB family protein [Lachnospiraceae bacterium]